MWMVLCEYEERQALLWGCIEVWMCGDVKISQQDTAAITLSLTSDSQTFRAVLIRQIPINTS